MRFFRENSIRFIALPVLLAISFLLLPQKSYCRGDDLVKALVQPMYDTGQFGEPGHDPFISRFQPEDRGFHGGDDRVTYTVPGSGSNGGGPAGPPLTDWDLGAIIQILGETLVRTISQQF